ncbi:tyrosinase, partial [Aspergillus bertholletiae]
MMLNTFAQVLLGLTLASSAFSLPDSYAPTKCTPERMQTHLEWTHLTLAQKQEYIDAELCLWNSPNQLHLKGSTNRFEDLQALHQNQTDIIHHVGQFLPFHRYFVHAHETLLRTECGYTGPGTWWNVSRDAGNFLHSPLFDDVTGFGGNGTGPDGCVTTGPFANRTTHMGPRNQTTSYCFWRSINETLSSTGVPSLVDECLAKATYYEMWRCVDLNPHASGHRGTGGVMEDPDVSPGDPLFYLHHGWIDRLWWQWQREDPTRLYQLGGYATITEPEGGWFNTTLDYIMTTFGILPDVTVADVMDTKGGYLCYDYD